MDDKISPRTSRELAATLGQCPEWDAAVTNFLRLQALSFSNDAFGPFKEANEAFDCTKMQIESKFGRGWRDNAEAVEAMTAASAAIKKAETEQSEMFLRPLWAAERTVAMTAAPTLNAALFKAELIDWEEIWNDSELERNGFEIVADELGRFAGDEQ